MKTGSTFKRIIMPGLLLQSVMIGGGYSTGRELVEFFLVLGPGAAIAGLVTACVGLSTVAALSFEFARLTRGYDYRTFFRNLIGPFWRVYEVAYFILGALVLAVIGAAAGEVFTTHFNLPNIVGVLSLTTLICALVLFGTAAIERVLSLWSFALYGVFIALAVIYFLTAADVTSLSASSDSATLYQAGGNGLRYMGYNIVSIPVILFCVAHMTSRRDAIAAGLLVGPFAMIPAGIFLLMLAQQYPDILTEPLPADALLAEIRMPWFTVIFYVIVFGTLVETGSAYIHAVNERIAASLEELGRTMADWVRPATAFLALAVSIILAETVGLIDLISKGYGTLTWVFLAIYVLPLITLAAFRIIRNGLVGTARRRGAP